jgi:hypothetical protein
MGTSVFEEDFPSNASEGQFCRLRATYGEAASLSTVEAESPVRYRGLGGLYNPARVELEPVVSEPERATKQSPATFPVWENGTLPGIMAGKRPSPTSIGPTLRRFPGGLNA